jgi:preprotein translocase subunit SecF
MSKKIVTMLMAVVLTVGVAGVSVAAKGVNCQVKAVDGEMVTLECKKDADSLKVGAKVKVSEIKKKAIEGC